MYNVTCGHKEHLSLPKGHLSIHLFKTNIQLLKKHLIQKGNAKILILRFMR